MNAPADDAVLIYFKRKKGYPRWCSNDHTQSSDAVQQHYRTKFDVDSQCYPIMHTTQVMQLCPYDLI